MNNLYLIGNAHIDPVWLWRWQEGFAEIRATFRSALDRMNEYPDFKFTSACAVYYEWIEKIDPEMFQEIRQRVAEGRWAIVGGWFLQPDCNTPSGESFARHALISQRYFKDKFGKIVTTGYNVDSFGHNAGLPQIFSQSGIKNYVFLRPGTHEKAFDFSTFKWEGEDGSTVTAYRIPWSYSLEAWEADKVWQLKEKADENKINYMAFIGVGNHGGGPTIKMIEKLKEMGVCDNGFSTPDEFFDNVDWELPVIHDELQHHARGCYSACSYVKAANRKAENNLAVAEMLSVMAKELAGVPYPVKKLKKAWKNVLFNQFHDIMGGCSIKEAYDDAALLYGEAMSITEQIINFAMQSVTKNIDTLQGNTLPNAKIEKSLRAWEHEVVGIPVIVFNPHARNIKLPVQLTSRAKKMTDWNGNEIPFQLVRASQTNGDDKWDTSFIAQVKPLGYTVYRLFEKQESDIKFTSELIADEYSLENSLVKVEFDKTTGDICSFYHKKNGKYIIDKPCRAILLDETDCDTWAHDKEYLGEITDIFGSPVAKVIESGTVRATVRITARSGNSLLRRDYTLSAGSDVLTVKTTVDFYEKHRTLKFTFPMTTDCVTAKHAYGAITRKENLGEEHCGSWLATGDLCVANDSKYGYDTFNGEVRLTVLRSTIYADHFGQNHRDEFCRFMEQGISEFTYAVYPFTTKADAEHKAQLLNIGARVITDSFHKGKLTQKTGCIECNNENIIVTAIKQCEDSNENIVRFYDANGVDSQVQMKIFGKELKTDISHHEIKTLDFNGNELNLLEWKTDKQ